MCQAGQEKGPEQPQRLLLLRAIASAFGTHDPGSSGLVRALSTAPCHVTHVQQCSLLHRCMLNEGRLHHSKHTGRCAAASTRCYTLLIHKRLSSSLPGALSHPLQRSLNTGRLHQAGQQSAMEISTSCNGQDCDGRPAGEEDAKASIA